MSVSCAFNWSLGRTAMLTSTARRHACDANTEQALYVTSLTQSAGQLPYNAECTCELYFYWIIFIEFAKQHFHQSCCVGILLGKEQKQLPDMGQVV